MSRTLTSIFSLIIAVLLYVFVADQQLSDMNKIQDEIEEYKLAETKFTEFQDKLKKLVNDKNQASVIENEKLDILVPDAIDDVKLAVDLEDMAKSRGLLFGNIEIGADSESSSDSTSSGGNISKGLQSTDISFEVIGTYEQFKSFLLDIERSLVLLEVVDLSFGVNEGSFQQYAVTVRSYAYSQ